MGPRQRRGKGPGFISPDFVKDISSMVPRKVVEMVETCYDYSALSIANA